MAAFGPPGGGECHLAKHEACAENDLGRSQGWRGRKVDPLSFQTKYNTPRSTHNTFWHNQKEIQQAVLEEKPLRETQHEKQGKITGKQQAVLKRANPRGAPESSSLFSQCFFSSRSALITFPDLRQKPQSQEFCLLFPSALVVTMLST